MSMVGGNLEQMAGLQQAFQRDAQSVTELQQRITAALGNTMWTGPAAQRFREEWSGTFVPALSQLRDALEQNATLVRNRSEAIRTATF